jgi:hypothetical protein
LKNRMEDEKIITILEDLIKRGTEFSKQLYSYEFPHYSDYDEHQTRYLSELVRWKGECMNILRLRFSGTTYLEDFSRRLNTTWQNSGEFYKENLKEAVGVLSYISHALKNGLTEDLFYQKEIILFSDLLEQSEEFLKKGHNLASAIYARIALELTLREFASKKGIENSEMNFEQLTIEMRKKGIILPPFEKSLNANYKIGSMAAHGDKDFEKISEAEIRGFISFIRDRILTL